MTNEFDNEPVFDKKLINKYALHKLVNNGGAIKFNSFGIRIVYDDKNPNNQFVELRMFAIPVNTVYKGNINPSLARAKATAEKKIKPIIKTEEEGEVEM